MQSIPITINRDDVAISGEVPVLYVGNTVLFMASLVDALGAAVVLDPTAEFYTSVDSELGPSHDDLAVSNNDQFNLSGDWDDVDLATGKISFRLSTLTDGIETFMSTARRKSVHFELWTRLPAGTWELLLHQEVILFNITSDFTPETIEGVTYATTTDLDDLVDVSDEGYSITAPSGGDVKTFNPNTATQADLLDFVATLAATLKSKGAI